MSRAPGPIEKAELAGVDLSLIDESLGYSYEQRAVHHQRALDMALEFERAGRAKEAIGREKDLQAVIQLRAIREKLKRS